MASFLASTGHPAKIRASRPIIIRIFISYIKPIQGKKGQTEKRLVAGGRKSGKNQDSPIWPGMKGSRISGGRGLFFYLAKAQSAQRIMFSALHAIFMLFFAAFA